MLRYLLTKGFYTIDLYNIKRLRIITFHTRVIFKYIDI